MKNSETNNIQSHSINTGLSAVHSEQREIDVQKLCEAVLDTPPNCWDNPNGAYETTCPFCYVEEHRGDGKGLIWVSMSELNYRSDCTCFLAKDCPRIADNTQIDE